MQKIFYLFYFAIACSVLGDDLEPNDLLLTFLVHRHGDRAPDLNEILNPNNLETVKTRSYPEGLGGLTREGKRRGYHIGKFIRERYGTNTSDTTALLSEIYFPNEIWVRSTDVGRTKMTVLTAMAALYPPIGPQVWSETIGKVWQPIPYYTTQMDKDYLTFFLCSNYNNLVNQSVHKNRSMFDKFEDLYQLLHEKTTKDFKNEPLFFEVLFNYFKSSNAIGIPKPDWAIPISDRLNEAANTVYKLCFDGEDTKRLGAGVILDDFLNTADRIVRGEHLETKVRVYSAHDFNVSAFMAVANVAINILEYGAVFALELRRIRATGEYVIAPVFIEEAGKSPPILVPINGCGDEVLCNYDKFKTITSKYAINETEYEVLCSS